MPPVTQDWQGSIFDLSFSVTRHTPLMMKFHWFHALEILTQLLPLHSSCSYLHLDVIISFLDCLHGFLTVYSHSSLFSTHIWFNPSSAGRLQLALCMLLETKSKFCSMTCNTFHVHKLAAGLNLFTSLPNILYFSHIEIPYHFLTMIQYPFMSLWFYSKFLALPEMFLSPFLSPGLLRFCIFCKTVTRNAISPKIP